MPTREARTDEGIYVHGNGYQDLADAIERASYTTTLHVPSTKQDLKQVYQQKYGKSWNKHLSEDFTRIKYGDSLSEKEFNKKVLFEERKFNKKRMDQKFSPTNAAVGASLGRLHATEEKTPKDITGKRARVTWTGRVRPYDEKRLRPQATYSGELSREEARDMRKNTGKNFEPIFESFGFGPDAVSEITVDKIKVDFF